MKIFISLIAIFFVSCDIEPEEQPSDFVEGIKYYPIIIDSDTSSSSSIKFRYKEGGSIEVKAYYNDTFNFQFELISRNDSVLIIYPKN